MAEHNREVFWTDGRHPGDVRLALTRDAARADIVDDILTTNSRARTLLRVEVVRSAGHLKYLRGNSLLAPAYRCQPSAVVIMS